MELCLSCKGCKSECPSNVDIARLKAEWQQHYHDTHGVPLRSRLVANFSRAMAAAALVPRLHNWVVTQPTLSGLLKRLTGFAPGRSLPTLPATTLRRWHARHANRGGPWKNGRVYLFCDEFTNFHDTRIGSQAVELLNRLGYEVIIPDHVDSGRAHFSKGLVRAAQRLAIRNVTLLAPVITDATPLIGIEPSALLGFRDEYPDLMPPELMAPARQLAAHALLFEEFIAREIDRGRITRAAFTTAPRQLKLHGHCHQKSLSSLAPAVQALSLPANYQVQIIPSGCCGMAGSFGYEAEHFALSQQIGELVLFPAVRATPEDTLLVASGTSCRHQIKDGTHRRALHPAEVLHAALL